MDREFTLLRAFDCPSSSGKILTTRSTAAKFAPKRTCASRLKTEQRFVEAARRGGPVATTGVGFGGSGFLDFACH
jgi:hypothetical protein